MKDPSSLLRAADPLCEESPDASLSQDDAQAIRRAMLAAIPADAEARPIWQRPFSLAAAAAVIVAASGIVGHRLMSGPEAEPSVPAQAQVQPGGGDGERRQLQFRTAGGTRIIWIFDDSLRLQEPMP